MKPTENLDRRKVLKTLGTGVGGGVVFAGNASGSPRNNFGYVEDSSLVGQTVTLSGPPRREKVFCDAGGSESRIKTEVWGASNDSVDGELYLIPSGYEEGDRVTVGEVFTDCTRNEDIEGEVSITKQ